MYKYLDCIILLFALEAHVLDPHGRLIHIASSLADAIEWIDANASPMLRSDSFEVANAIAGD